MSEKNEANSIKIHRPEDTNSDETIDDLKHSLERLQSLEKSLQNEAPSLKTDKLQLQLEISNVDVEIQRLDERVSIEKTKIKTAKRNITDWKEWYSNLDAIDKSDDFSRLTAEINSQGSIIEGCQTRLTPLLQKIKEIEVQKDQLESNLEAIDSGELNQGQSETNLALNSLRDEIREIQEQLKRYP